MDRTRGRPSKAEGQASTPIAVRLTTWATRRLRRITSSQAYRPEVDGVRFIAVAIVVVGHMLQRIVTLNTSLPAPTLERLAVVSRTIEPYLGVQLFFGISGFIITSQFIRQDNISWNPRNYILRRITRIEPPYIFILIVTFVLISFFNFHPINPKFNAAPTSLTKSLIFSTLYLHVIAFGSAPRLFPPGWSLEVEVQFYILAPLICILFLKAPPRIRSLAAPAVLALGILVADLVDLTQNSHLTETILRMFPYFWVGVVLADLHRRGALARLRLPGHAIVAVWLVSLLALLASALIPVGEFYRVILLFALQSFCVAGLLLTALVEGPIKKLMAAPLLSVIGGACYSIYLVHLQILQLTIALCARLLRHASAPAMLAVEVAASLSLVLVVGMTFFVAVERPCMIPNWPRRVFEWATGRNAAAAPAGS